MNLRSVRRVDDGLRVGIVAVIVAVIAVAGLVAVYQIPKAPTEQASLVIVHIEMSSGRYFFNPKIVSPQDGVRQAFFNPSSEQYADARIVVKKDDTVRILVTSTDLVHGFGFLEWGINKQTPPGETVTIEFLADQVGSFAFFCTVFCGIGHPQHLGTLIVEP